MATPFNLAKMHDLTVGDPDFKAELFGTYVANFEAFPDEYSALLRSGNVAGLKFAVHRIKASVRMIEATELDRLLEQSPLLIGADADMEASIERVKAICKELAMEMRAEMVS